MDNDTNYYCLQGVAMGKLEDVIAKYQAENENLVLGIEPTLLAKVAKSLGPTIYNNDACRVSSSDAKEIETVKKNYLIGKLGLSETDDLDNAIRDVMTKLGSANKNKYRALVYAMLCEKFSKQDLYTA
jgi:small subunit ribosomal protein S1